MPKRIEKDLEELSVNIFVNEYGSLRAVYNRLYVIIHVYYSGRRQLLASEDTIPLEKLLQMRKDIIMRLERVNSLIEDQQFPQENFAEFAKEKLNKMNLAIGVMETASLIGELSSYSKTIMDYMKSCCTFASKFITVLSDPVNQDLKALKNNITTLLGQVDVLIRRRQSSQQGKATLPLTGPLSREKGKATLPLTGPLSREKGKATLPLSGPLSISQREGARGGPAEAHSGLDPSHGRAHKEHQIPSTDGDPMVARPSRQQEVRFVPAEVGTPSPLVSNVDEALNILEKIDLFRSKSRPLKADVSSSETSDAKDVGAGLGEQVQQHSADSSGAHKFEELLDEKYGFHSESE